MNKTFEVTSACVCCKKESTFDVLIIHADIISTSHFICDKCSDDELKVFMPDGS